MAVWLRYRGGLWYRPAPDVWLWLLIPFVFVVGAVTALRFRDVVSRRAAMWLAALAVAALVVARAGREFYGRPTPAVAGYVSFAIGVGIAVWALYRLLVRPTDYTWLVALVIGVVAAAESAALLAVLYRPVVLAVFPAGWSARALPLRSAQALPPHSCACSQGWRTRRTLRNPRWTSPTRAL